MGFGKDGKGAMIRERHIITLGALVAGAVLKSDAQLAIEEDFRIIKTEVFPSLLTHAVGEAPIYFGIADNELSVTEIAEALEVDGPLDRNDRVKVEQAERPVWILGQFLGDQQDVSDNPFPVGIVKNLRWTFSNPEGWTWFAFNGGPDNLTTGAFLRLYAVHYGVWVT